MSLKSHHQPGHREPSAIADPAAMRAENDLLSRIRRIRTSAEQICADATDIEDARFLAENIIDACRQILANGLVAGAEGATTAQSTGQRQAGHRAAVQPPCMGRPDAVRARAAVEKLSVLTERELEIFRHLAEGCSAADISTKLSRSGKTINNHRTRILHKLGLKNATELVRLAASAGLISV